MSNVQKFYLLAWVLLLPGALRADIDTVPLKNKTIPRADGEALEGKLLDLKEGPILENAKRAKKSKAHPVDRPYVASIDVFGSSRITESTLRKTLGNDLNLWIEKGLQGDASSLELEKKLVEKLKTKFDLASADWSIVQMFDPGDMALHITLDVVEKADVARRMPFLPEPTGQFSDPGNLIRTWLEYESTAIELIESGKIEPESETCPAFHCPFGHKHPRLKKFEKIFVEGVKKHAAALEEILVKDARPDFRGPAAYLLAYLKDGTKVVSLMVDRIRDPNELVRNNALRVLGDIAQFHGDLIIPIRPVISALEFPRVSDRTKAVFVLYLMAMNSQTTRDEMMKAAVPDLLALLDSKQPDQRDVAHTILRKMSGKDFPAGNVADWQRWYERAANERQISKK